MKPLLTPKEAQKLQAIANNLVAKLRETQLLQAHYPNADQAINLPCAPENTMDLVTGWVISFLNKCDASLNLLTVHFVQMPFTDTVGRTVCDCQFWPSNASLFLETLEDGELKDFAAKTVRNGSLLVVYTMEDGGSAEALCIPLWLHNMKKDAVISQGQDYALLIAEQEKYNQALLYAGLEGQGEF